MSLLGRVFDGAAGIGLQGLTMVTDALPPRIRFGHWNTLMNRLALTDGLPSVASGEPLWQSAPAPAHASQIDLRSLIVAGALDTGGVETVVATLAEGLPAHGIDVEVICSDEGRISHRLRDRGVRVTRVPTEGLAGFVETRQPDAIQLHRIDRDMLTALTPTAPRTIPVFHAMESYIDEATWSVLEAFAQRSSTCIAVSPSVADFFAARIAITADVVVNGVASPLGDLSARHEGERSRLATAIGVQFAADDVVVVALQRFSDQKNAAGLVDAFLLAAESDPRLRLVMAGAPSSWLEVRRADILRKTHPAGGRVHLLGDSDPAALLLGGDMFALDSFAEGGPVSAVEAVACGLPVVLSDVGFTRDLVAAAAVPGRVIRRANETLTQASYAAQRRRRHQSNRADFAAALLALAGTEARRVSGPPDRFSLPTMIAGHARALRVAAEAKGHG